MIVFLDDNLDRVSMFLSHYPEAHVVHTVEDTIKAIEDLEIDSLYLDHDLGGGTQVDSDRPDTGMEVVRWILENKPEIPKIIVHSMNFNAGPLMAEKLNLADYKVAYEPFKKLFPEYKGL